jgi:hypothetical protein
MGFYSFFDVFPPSASTFGVAVFCNLADVAAILFRNLLLFPGSGETSKAEAYLGAQLGPIHISEAGGTRLHGRDSVAS